MRHLVAHALPGTLLFHDWTEARALWDRLLALGPPEALVLMPDHVHAVLARTEPGAWGAILSAYARWRHRRRGETGPAWRPAPPPREIPDRQHLDRTIRYVLLNPCRAHLAADPLAWPFSTHRDCVGFAVPAARPVARDTARFHAWVSADPSVAVTGTPLPAGAAAGPEAVLRAVSAVTRTPRAGLGAPGLARDLAVRSLADLCGLSDRAIARQLPVSHATVSRTPPVDGRSVALVLQVSGDPRFPALDDVDLGRVPAWRAYVRRRAAR